MADVPAPNTPGDSFVTRSALPNETPVIALTSDEPAPMRSPILQIGGFLGIAGCFIGLGAVLASCAGLGKALAAGVVVMGLGALGFFISLIGALFQHKRITEDTHVLAAFFVCVLSIVGGLLEVAVWQRWEIIPLK